jgi:hypothetical protein
MSNSLVPPGGNLPANAAEEFFGNLNQTYQPVASGMGQDFLNFSGKSGRYEFNDGNPEGREVLMNIPGMKHGYRCWVDKKPVDELVPINTQRPQQPPGIRDVDGEMQDFKNCYQLEGQFADGANEEFVLTLNSIGGCSSVEQLINACRVQAAAKTGFYHPMVKLEAAPMNDQYGNYKPVFKIVNWMNDAGELETGTAKIAKDDDPAEEEPKRRSRRSRG